MPKPKLGSGFAVANAFEKRAVKGKAGTLGEKAGAAIGKAGGAGRAKNNPKSLKQIQEAIAEGELPECLAVEGAIVVCSQMNEYESDSHMKKTDTSNAIMLQGGYKLVHTDIEFEPKFEKCRYCDGDCEPEIENEEWHEFDEDHQSNGGYGVLEEKSFMVCTKGFGMLFISEDGQRLYEGYRLAIQDAIKRGESSLLGLVMASAFGGDPVNMATGNFIFTWTDLEIEGRASLKFNRFYNTMDDHVGTLGRGWNHPYDITLCQTEKGVTIRFGDGHEELYKMADETNQSSEKEEEKPTKCYRLSKPDEVLTDLNEEEYKAPDGNFNQLIKLGSEHRLVKPEGTTLYFNGKGQLFKVYDQDQNKTILNYEGEHLISVTSPAGSFAFTYEKGKIVTLTDHTGRTVKFSYEDDLLVSASDPLCNVHLYTYDNQGRFFSEINPERNLIVENEYDEQDRIVKQSCADGSTFDYAYDDEAKTTEFIRQNGAKIIYERDRMFRTTGVVFPDGGEVQTEFNSKNQKISETDQIGNRTYYDHDKKGNLSKIARPLGDVLELDYNNNNKITNISINGKERTKNEYNHNGKLVATEDGLGRKTTFTYNENQKSLPETITQPDGSEIKLAYDERGNLTRITNAVGVRTCYEYNMLNRMIKAIDGKGNETKFTYDLNGNILTIQNAEGNIQKLEYNKANKVTTITDFDGSQIRIEYNSLNKPSKVIDQLDRETVLNYDSMWNISHVIQPNGAESHFIYDENNRLVRIQNPDESTVEYEYDLNGNKTRIVDENGNQTKLKYDALNRLVEMQSEEGFNKVYAYNSEGQVTSVTDALENTTYFEYDDVGQLIKETNVLGASRIYTYTSLGKPATVTDEAGRITSYEYELGGRLKTTHHPDKTTENFVYDGNGNIKTYTNKLGVITIYLYDSLDRITEIISPNGGKKQYTYDAISNVTSMTDELGNVTKYEYTLTGKLSKVINALGYETCYEYNELDQLIEVRQVGEILQGLDSDYELAVKQNIENQRILKYQRNKLGQIESVIDALGQEVRAIYDLGGQLIERVDKDGYPTKYSYTPHGDMKHIQYSDGKEVEFFYNPLRQLTEVRDWLGLTKIEVDPLGRATKITNHNNQEVGYLWGSTGELKQITYPDGKIVEYHYDDLLRLIQIKDGNQHTHYIYDDYSQLIEKRYPNNTSTKYQFNDFGQLQQFNHYEQHRSMDQYYFEYDKMGNKVRAVHSRHGDERLCESNGSYDYRYDALNRLERVIKDKDVLRSYQYDPFGNRSKLVEKGNQISYTYNVLNQLISSLDINGTMQKYSYDSLGNLIEVYKNDRLTHEYFFGMSNRLEEALNYEIESSATYVYNGLGHRVGKTVGDMEFNPIKQIDDVLDLTKQYHNLLQRKESNITSRFLEEQGSLISTFTWDLNVLTGQIGDERLYYLNDSLGSPIRLINERGSVQDVLGYDEFGSLLYQSKHEQPFSFTGYQIDELTNTMYAQAREYVPRLGRFISEDIHWYPENMIYGDHHVRINDSLLPNGYAMIQAGNLYGYCGGNPLLFVDSSGMDFYIFHGTDQANAAAYYRTQLERAHPGVPIHMRYISDPGDFQNYWNAMGSGGDISGVIVNLHGNPNGLFTCDSVPIPLDNLERRTMPWLLLLSCQTGHLDVSNNPATRFARDFVDGVVVSSDGNHRRHSRTDGSVANSSVAGRSRPGRGKTFVRRTISETGRLRSPEGFILFYNDNGTVNNRQLLESYQRTNILGLLDLLD